MGRRALRKNDPTLDLSGYLYALEDLPKPFDPAAVFLSSAPLEIEVGSGKGLFLQSACASVPEHRFLGIELAQKYARHCAARLAKRQLTNGKVVSGDALRFFHEWLPNQCASAVHVYFPDPWWKKRHHKRRVMTDSFLRQIVRVLKPAGRLHFWTDVEEYFQQTLTLITTIPELLGPQSESERPAEHELDYRTHFERRMRLQGLPVFRSVFSRSGDRHSAQQ
jgi:tRNA (guanine-N7-)-methyltransferase